MELENVTHVDFVAELPHKVSIVICLKCFVRYTYVRPVGTYLKDLECKTCGVGFIIETGEVVQ